MFAVQEKIQKRSLEDHYKKFHKDASFKESLVAESKSLAFGLKKSTQSETGDGSNKRPRVDLTKEAEDESEHEEQSNVSVEEIVHPENDRDLPGDTLTQETVAEVVNVSVNGLDDKIESFRRTKAHPSQTL